MSTEQATPENLDSVMRRIAKLLAIAGDDRANPEEASAAAGMAERIMRKYQLEHADVIMASLKAGNDMGQEDCIATAKTNGTKVLEVPTWAGWLAVLVAKVNDCGTKIVRTPSGEAAVRFYGFTADVKVAAYTFNYLVATTNRLCKAFLKTDAYIFGGRATVNSYRQGVSVGILASLRASLAAKAEEVKQNATGTSLMVVKAQLVAEHFGEMKTRTGSRSTVSRDGAFSSGVRDGKSVNVGARGVGGSSSSTLRIG